MRLWVLLLEQVLPTQVIPIPPWAFQQLILLRRFRFVSLVLWMTQVTAIMLLPVFHLIVRLTLISIHQVAVLIRRLLRLQRAFKEG